MRLAPFYRVLLFVLTIVVGVCRAPRAAAEAGDTVFMIQIDGAAYAQVDALLKAKKLPVLQALLASRGGFVRRVLTTLPSSTAPSLPELMVGRYSDRCKEDLLRRVQAFDRNSGEVSRYEFERRAWDSSDVDLFELVARQGRRSFAYFEGEFRSASVNDFNPLGYRIEFATGYARLPTINYDHQVIDAVMRDLRNEKPPAALIFVGLGAVDINGHARGPDSVEYSNALIDTDKEIGRLVELTQQLAHPNGGSVFEHSHFFVFGDHGMTSTQQHINLGLTLKQMGVLAADGADLGSMLQASLLRDWHKNYDAVVLGIGSNAAELQFRRRSQDGKRRPWQERPQLSELRAMPTGKKKGNVDVIGLLAAHPGIQLVIVKEAEGRVQLHGPGGSRALVVREGAAQGPRRYAYRVQQTDPLGHDPLGYLQDANAQKFVTPVCAKTLNYYDDAQWLQATQATAQPYGPPLLPKLFGRGSTDPDVVVLAYDGFGFLPVVKGDHGSLSWQSASTMLLVASDNYTHTSAPALLRLIDLNLEVRRLLELPLDKRSDSRGFVWQVAPVTSSVP